MWSKWILDTFGSSAVVELIGNLAHPGTYYLAFAEEIAAGTVSDADVDALYWASQAVENGVPSGCISL